MEAEYAKRSLGISPPDIPPWLETDENNAIPLGGCLDQRLPSIEDELTA